MSIAVRRFHDLVGEMLHRLLHLGGFEFSADKPLDRKYRIVGVRDRLPLRDLADQPLAALGDRDHGRRGPAPFRVRNHDRLAAFHDRDAGVGRPQINSYNFCHCIPP